MTAPLDHRAARGAAPVGVIADLDAIAAASVIYLRMWRDSAESRHSVQRDFATALGSTRGVRVFDTLGELCRLCALHGRRPLVHHDIKCHCIGADEACFANFIAVAADGDREDAMLIATLLVRPDVAPLLASLATNFAIALKQMNLAAPRDIKHQKSSQTTLH